ncbi:MAG: PD-(D/E)XK nuclease family protein [Alphaproteobacteria bacterium]
MQQVEGIKFPSFPGFNLNEATDVLLKRDFDHHRLMGTSHPFLEKNGLGHLVPFNDERFELWTQSLHFGAEGRFNTVHAASNLKVGGGLDDVWLNTKTNQVHVVDYKSTSQKTDGRPITLEGEWKAAYKRQMDFYVWVMSRLSLDVSSIGYFLYVDGDRFKDQIFLGEDEANMSFKVTLIAYETDISWVERTLVAIRKTLHKKQRPLHHPACEHGGFIDAARPNL